MHIFRVVQQQLRPSPVEHSDYELVAVEPKLVVTKRLRFQKYHCYLSTNQSEEGPGADHISYNPLP